MIKFLTFIFHHSNYIIKEKVKKAPTTGLLVPSDEENTNSKVVEFKLLFYPFSCSCIIILVYGNINVKY